MIEKKQVETRTCDVCGAIVSDNGEKTFGGSVFKGWHRVEKTDGGTTVDVLKKNNTIDVCSNECLLDFSINWKEYPAHAPYPEYNGQRVISTYFVTVELLNRDKLDDNEVTLAVWYSIDSTWRYYIDHSKKYGDHGWKVVAWASLPTAYNT